MTILVLCTFFWFSVHTKVVAWRVAVEGIFLVIYVLVVLTVNLYALYVYRAMMRPLDRVAQGDAGRNNTDISSNELVKSTMRTRVKLNSSLREGALQMGSTLEQDPASAV